jgi:predicted MFS family arabinose efflux permease
VSSVADEGARLITPEFLILATATMLYFAGMGASNPLIPKFVVDELGGSEAVAGIVFGTFAVSALVTRSWFGRLGDRRGARRLVVIGCLLATVSMALMVVTTTVAVAVVARLVYGAAQAALMTGAAVLAINLAPESRRGEAASYILVAFHLGLGLGPLGGEAVLAATSYGFVWAVIGVLSLAGAGVAMLLPHRPGDPDAPPSPWIHPAGIVPGLVAAFGIAAFVAFSTFVPLYGREIGLDRVGGVFMVASISIAVVRLAFGRAPDVLGPIRACTIALGLTVVGALVIAAWETIAGVFVAAVVLAGGMALQTPALIPVAVDGVDPQQRSSAMATFTMFLDLSVALVGPVIGLIVAGAGYRTAFFAGGLMSAVALVILHLQLAPRWRQRGEHLSYAGTRAT